MTDVTEPTLGSVEIGMGGSVLVYTPDPNANGVDTFEYTVNGGLTATVEVDIAALNEDPVAVNDSATILEDAQPTVIDVLENDDDNDSDTLEITGISGVDATKGSVEIIQAGSLLHYHPADDAFGVDTFTYTIDDGEGGTDRHP